MVWHRLVDPVSHLRQDWRDGARQKAGGIRWEAGNCSNVQASAAVELAAGTEACRSNRLFPADAGTRGARTRQCILLMARHHVFRSYTLNDLFIFAPRLHLHLTRVVLVERAYLP